MLTKEERLERGVELATRIDELTDLEYNFKRQRDDFSLKKKNLQKEILLLKEQVRTGEEPEPEPVPVPSVVVTTRRGKGAN